MHRETSHSQRACTGTVPAVCIVGRKNAGKTTLIERLLREFVRRGRRLATIKHDAHDFEIDVPGKDTWRHREAGSRTTIIASSKKVAIVRLVEREAELDELLALVDASYDMVLVEGFRSSPMPKVVIESSEANGDMTDVGGEVWAVVSERSAASANVAPAFAPTDIGALADLLERRLLRGAGE